MRARRISTAVIWALVALCGLCRLAEAATTVRIKDLAKVQMGQELQLTGIGLVIGLEGTGDGRRRRCESTSGLQKTPPATWDMSTAKER